MLPTFHWPAPEEFALLLLIGGLGGTGNIVFIAATRRAPISQIAPAQYSQILWAIVFGAIFFHESPDAVAYCGLVVVAFGGILNVMSDETRIRIFSRLSVFGPASAAGEVSPPIGKDARPAEPPRGQAVHGK
jgi:drug/metabolite transporter (DMT)-like permease